MSLRKHLCYSLLLICAYSFSFAQKSASSESDLKKKAEKTFNEEKYEDATAMYSQLLSLYPQNPTYNYRYGVCLLLSGKDKTQASGYLETALKNPRAIPEVHFYLGRSYIYAGHYSEAIAEFDQYKKIGNAAKVSKLKVDLFIENCKNAIELNKDRKNISVISQKEVTRNTFYTNYDFKNASGKLLTATDNFLTPKDKEKMNFPVMFMAKDGQTIFYASYGTKGLNGKDLHKILKMPDGNWSEPMNLGGAINTDENEDYPYMDKDGKTLYFCSKGHNSIGGYDIFKSTYDFRTGEWSKPENLGIPINSPDDDLFYVPNTTGDLATYATAVESEAGKVSIRNIKLGDVISDVAVISGVYVSKDQAMRRDARISVVDEAGNGVITSVHTNPKTGEYELVLPAGANYMLIVDGGSYLPHAEYFELPKTASGLNLRQKVLMNKNGQKEQMTLSNFFSAPLVNAKTETEKPTEVKSSEIIASEMDSTKMKPVTIEGKTVYIAPPPLSNTSQNNNVVSSIEKKTEQGEEPGVNEKEEKSVGQTKSAPEQPLAETQKISTETEARDENKPVETNVEPDHVNSKPAITEKTSNPELVKMSFTEAYSLKEEAQTTKEQAAQKKEEAKALDSLSKSQLTNAEQFITSDKELSKRLFSESKENATQAESKMNEAASLDAEAKEKDQEADRSIQEATKLMTELKVDTHTVAYRSIPKSNLEKSKTKSNKKETAQPPSDNTGQPSAKESNQAAATQAIAATENKDKKVNNELDSNVHPEEKEIAKATLPVNEHRVKAEKLLAESNTLSDHSYEQSQMASASNDKKEKAKLENQAKELKKQSTAKKTEAEKELALAQKEEKALENVAIKTSAPTSAAGNEKPADNKANESKNINSQSSESKVAGEMSVKAKNETSISTNENVNPKAEKHYNTYIEKSNQSKTTEKQIDDIRNKIEASNSSKEKDSLVTKANELNKESITQWQEAQSELDKAKAIDPDVERKLGQSQELKSSSDLVSSSDMNNPETEANRGANSKSSEVTAENISNAPSGTNANDNTTSNVETVEILDTTRAEYPKYKEVQEQIKEKQTETVNVFIEGMQINKKAIAVKEEELRLRDEAQVETNLKKKNQLLAKADSVKFIGDSLTNASKNKLLEAKQNTGSVKSLTAESNELKKALVVKTPADKPSSTTALANNNKETNSSSEPSKSQEKTTPTSLADNKTDTKKSSTPTKTEEKPAHKNLISETSKADLKEETVQKEASQNASQAKENNAAPTPVSSSASEQKILPTEYSPSETQTFSLSKSNTNSTTSNIPMDPSLPEGLVFKVQIGAFKTPLPDNAFGNLQPLSGESTRPGWIRYCLGLFRSFEPANLLKKDVRDKGYRDAFVVAYFNGKRISLSEAYAMMSKASANEKQTYAEISDKEFKHLAQFQIQSSTFDTKPDNDTKSFYGTAETIPSDLIEYAVQVGAYKTSKAPKALNSLLPLNAEKTAKGIYRFTTGRFTNYSSADSMKNVAVNTGVKDAFIVIYRGGAKISGSETTALLKNARSTPAPKESNVSSTPPSLTSSNSAATTEEISSSDIIFKVQLGAFKESVPTEMVNSFLQISDKGITQETDSRGLHIFYAGQYNSYDEVMAAKSEITSKGIKDAFVVAFAKGKRISVTEGQNILNRK